MSDYFIKDSDLAAVVSRIELAINHRYGHSMISKIRRRLVRVMLGDPRLRLLHQMPKDSICAEIGVWKGGFSERILEITRPRMLHLIDPWLFQPAFPERMYGGAVAKNQADMDNIACEVSRRLAGRFPNVRIHRGSSAEILPTFGAGFFDWVYIDGNHYYDFVRDDLELSRLVVKPGGIIAGDDYIWLDQRISPHYCPVRAAVRQFLHSHNISQSRLKVLADSQFIIRL